MNTNFAEKITAAIKLGAIGDGLGLQTEAQRSWQILEIFPTGVNKLLPLNSVNIHPDYKDTSGRGITSDDTLFMLATIEGLLMGNGWDEDIQLQSLIRYYDKDPIGFGKNTRAAIKTLRKGGSLPNDNPGAVGSGPVTRLFPLSAWLGLHNIPDTERSKIIRDMTRQTHPNETACHCSQIHDQVLTILMTGNHDPRDILHAISHEKFTIPHLKELFKDKRTPTNMEIRLAYGLDEGKINSINRAFAIWNILGASYAFFLLNPHNFQSVIDAASNGGDTDSMAHIIGTMMGLYAPEVAKEQAVIELFDQLQMKKEIEESAHNFVEKF